MPAPNPTTQLKADLKKISDAIKRADGVPDSIKSLFGELVAWNEAIVEHAKDLDDRLESSEAAIDEILEGAGEMISPETAATLISSIQHGQMLCAALGALLEGPFTTMDEIAKQRIIQLVELAQESFTLSSQVIAEITADEERTDGDGNRDGDRDGDGDVSPDDDEEVAEDEGADE